MIYSKRCVDLLKQLFYYGHKQWKWKWKRRRMKNEVNNRSIYTYMYIYACTVRIIMYVSKECLKRIIKVLFVSNLPLIVFYSHFLFFELFIKNYLYIWSLSQTLNVRTFFMTCIAWVMTAKNNFHNLAANESLLSLSRMTNNQFHLWYCKMTSFDGTKIQSIIIFLTHCSEVHI